MGFAVGTGTGQTTGGGLFNLNNASSFVSLQNCTFANNHAESSGGGLYVYNNDFTTIENCRFVSNSVPNAKVGAGAQCNR